MAQIIHELPDKNIVKTNLLVAYMAAGAPRSSWYEDINILCVQMSVEYGLPVEVIAAIIAVISPSMNWNKNIHNARLLIEFALENSKDLDYFFSKTGTAKHLKIGATISGLFAHVQGYDNNKFKALQIVHLQDPSYCRGPKVNAFLDNIYNLTSERVTIDIWMIRVCLWDWTVHIKNNPYAQERFVNFFAECLVELANELNVLPKNLQAAIWEQGQKISKNELAILKVLV